MSELTLHRKLTTQTFTDWNEYNSALQRKTDSMNRRYASGLTERNGEDVYFIQTLHLKYEGSF